MRVIRGPWISIHCSANPVSWMLPTSRWIPTAGLCTSFRNCQNSRGLMRKRCSALQFSHPMRTPARAAFSPSAPRASTQRWYTSLYGTSSVTRPATTRIASLPSSTAVSISRSTMRIARARTAGSRADRGVAQCRPVDTLETTRPASSTFRRSSRTSASAVLSWNQGTSPSHSSMPSKPACFTSCRPLSNPHSFGIMLSPIAFFMDASYAKTARPATPAHFDGRRFRNPNGANGLPFWLVPRMLLTPRSRWPARVAVEPRRPPTAGPDDVVVTFVGHATFLIQVGATALLTDPIYAERASPVSFAGPRRVRAPGVRFDDLPAISLVLLSHNHYDHCDLVTLHALERRF